MNDFKNLPDWVKLLFALQLLLDILFVLLIISLQQR